MQQDRLLPLRAVIAAPLDSLGEPVRQSRRLADRLLVAAHQAMDLEALDIAHALLGVVGDVMRQLPADPASASRRSVEGMVAAHHRLWHLRRNLDHQG